MGQECSCHCGDGKSEMNYQEVSYAQLFTFNLANEHDAEQLVNGGRARKLEQREQQK